jgi:CelD/BcsL family acetyltransferase involved in cellulose biosynthesis
MTVIHSNPTAPRPVPRRDPLPTWHPDTEPDPNAIARSPLSLTCRVFTDFSSIHHLRGAWDEAVVQAGGSIYMTYDWVRVWWEHYGHTGALRLFVFFSADRIVALLPIYIDTIGPLRFRVARLVGANIPPKVFNPPIPEVHASAVLTTVLEHLLFRDRCDVLSIGPVSETEPWTTWVRRICRQRADLVGRCETKDEVHSVFHLPSDMEEYFSALSKNERKNRRKYELRLLKKEHDTQQDVVCDESGVSAELEQFAEQHRRQWLAEGRTGHFGAWPGALAFNRALVNAQARLGRVRFIRIVADGQVVANQYTFVFAGRYYWELPARAVDPKWDRFSLGPTAIVTMLGDAITEGMDRVEGGLAHYDYKLRLGAKEYAAPTYRIVAAGIPSRARFAIMSLVRRCADLAYHKVWYRRIAPRLPAWFWRHQPRWWLRLDF